MVISDMGARTCRCAGNELADEAAKKGGLRDQKGADIDMSSAF